jgi:predicted anti-sigma-YlaC factor YlaD
MRIASAKSEHWTDDQLIDHLYGVGPGDGHLPNCAACLARFAAIETRRRQLPVDDSVNEDLLAAQRRAVYARLEKPRQWWHAWPLGRTAAAAVMLIVFAGTFTVYQSRQREKAESRADAQLAQEVSQMSFESESPATAPLKGLFVE